MNDGLLAVQARIGSLDRQIRSVDPTWVGVAGSTPPADASFDEALASATSGEAVPSGTSAGNGAASTATTGTTPADWSAKLLGLPAASTNGVDDAALVVAPVRGARISQDFGPTSFRGEPPATVDGVHYAHYHDGLDLAAPLGRPVRAIAAGTVVAAGRAADGAVIVRIRHADGSESLYGHLGAGLDVHEGDRVRAGDQIGVIGLTGNTTGPHLHLELTRNGRKLDPERVIAAGRLPGADHPPGLDRSVLPVAAPTDPRAAYASGASVEAVARFDRIADRIPHAAAIRSAAIAAGIDPLLLAALVKAESGFRADAVSPVGAMGLTQLMPATATSLHVTNPFDPEQNAAGGARYFASNLRIYGRVDLALAAYQAGKGAVARAGGIPDSPTTHRYIDRILTTWSGYLEAAA
jgi:hypothetical protein